MGKLNELQVDRADAVDRPATGHRWMILKSEDAVKLRVDAAEVTDHASGDGVVDACYKVITKITGSQSHLVRYTVNAITGGADAQGEVSCVIEDDGIRVSGQGAHTDIIMASALAYINGLNKLEGRKHYRQVVEKEGP